MAVYRLGDDSPVVAATAYVAPNAVIVGKVVLAENSTVWFGATLRGDNEIISIGSNSNVQDSAVLHTDPGFPLSIGSNVSIGHQAMMHGCSVGDGSLIGIQSIVLNGAVIGKGCLVGAGGGAGESAQSGGQLCRTRRALSESFAPALEAAPFGRRLATRKRDRYVNHGRC